MKQNLKKVLGVLMIAFVVLLTIRYIKVLSPVLKVLALGLNVITIYYTIQLFKGDEKTKSKEDDANGYEKDY